MTNHFSTLRINLTSCHQLEILLNHAGRFVYDFIFSPNHVDARAFNARINALMEKVLIFMSKIQEHCLNYSGIVSTSRANIVGSSFILASVIEDLVNFINLPCPRPSSKDVVRDKIKRFHKELVSCIKDVQVFQGVSKDELDDSLVETKDMAYGIEYVRIQLVYSRKCSALVSVTKAFFSFVKKMKKARGKLEEIENICDMRVLEISKDLSGEEFHPEMWQFPQV